MVKKIAEKTAGIDMSGYRSRARPGDGQSATTVVNASVSEPHEASKKYTGVGVFMDSMTGKEEVSKKLDVARDELRIANRKLSTFEGSAPVRKLDPTLIRRSKWANRHEKSFLDSEFDLLKEDIKAAGGNVQPIKVRPLVNEDGFYEIVFGHRRHQACVDLGIPVLALIEEVSEQELFVEMDRENRQRKDLRPYEQGLMYKRALDDGLFPSARKLAEYASVDLTNLGKALALARLPDAVLRAFDSPLDIQLRWASDLTQALQKDPDLVLAHAKNIQKMDPRPTAKKVLLQLVTAGGSSELPPAVTRISITGKSGQSGSMCMDASARSVVINLKNIAPERFDEIQKSIKLLVS